MNPNQGYLHVTTFWSYRNRIAIVLNVLCTGIIRRKDQAIITQKNCESNKLLGKQKTVLVFTL